jgi:hypothetical protein
LILASSSDALLKAPPSSATELMIGRTKFWYRKVEDGYRVYFYDECWELAAAKALLQLVTPAGTIPNRNQVFNDEQ